MEVWNFRQLKRYSLFLNCGDGMPRHAGVASMIHPLRRLGNLGRMASCDVTLFVLVFVLHVLCLVLYLCYRYGNILPPLRRSPGGRTGKLPESNVVSGYAAREQISFGVRECQRVVLMHVDYLPGTQVSATEFSLDTWWPVHILKDDHVAGLVGVLVTHGIGELVPLVVGLVMSIV